MGIPQCYSLENIKTSFNEIYNILHNDNSSFVKEFLLDCQNVKNHLLNCSKDNLCNVSKKYKNISNYQTNENKKEIFLKWFEIIHSTIMKHSNLISIKQKIEIKLSKLYKKDKKNIIELSKQNIPKSLRSIIWIILSNKILYERRYIIYNNLLNTQIDILSEDQINKDINRTFKQPKSNEIILKLKNLLHSFTVISSNVGYCQGMNFIAGLLLEITNYDEVDSFYLFCYILENVRGYFMKEFPLFNYHLYIFEYYFKHFFPKLEKHFQELELPLELLVGKWIQTLFIVNLPLDECCRILDYLFIYGFDFIIPICFSILYYLENNLLKLKDSSDVINFIKESLSPKDIECINDNIEKRIIPIDKIIKKAKQYKKMMNKNEITKLKIEFENQKHININNLFSESYLNKINNNQSKSFSIFRRKFEPITINKINNLCISANLKTEVCSKNGFEIDELSDSCDECFEDNNRKELSNRIIKTNFNIDS